MTKIVSPEHRAYDSIYNTLSQTSEQVWLSGIRNIQDFDETADLYDSVGVHEACNLVHMELVRKLGVVFRCMLERPLW